jgi:hypothetical protein
MLQFSANLLDAREWNGLPGREPGFRLQLSGFGGFRGLRAAPAEPALRNPCYTFPFAVETLLATSCRQRQASTWREET